MTEFDVGANIAIREDDLPIGDSTVTFTTDMPTPPKIKVYLAGPMRGVPEFNFPHFLEVAADLRNRNYCVTSPAEMDLVEYGTIEGVLAAVDRGELTLAKVMKRDLPAVLNADQVAYLRGWEHSTGAILEGIVGVFTGKKLVHAYNNQPVNMTTFVGAVVRKLVSLAWV